MGLVRPGHKLQRSFDRPAQTVRVAIGKTHAVNVFIHARHIEKIERAGHLNAGSEDLFGLADGKTLAANGPANIHENRIQVIDWAFFGQESFPIRQSCDAVLSGFGSATHSSIRDFRPPLSFKCHKILAARPPVLPALRQQKRAAN